MLSGVEARPTVLYIHDMKTYWVYMLRCADQSYYTGITNDLELRWEQHRQGTDPKAYTYSRRPLELVFAEVFNDPQQAIAWEKKIKGWTRAKKQALIDKNGDKLKDLSVCKNQTHSSNQNKGSSWFTNKQ